MEQAPGAFAELDERHPGRDPHLSHADRRLRPKFNYLLEKRDQLIGEANSINDAISRGDLRLASSIVRASGHIDEDVKAGLIANGIS